MDGIDLTTLIDNEQPDRTVYTEYLAGTTTAPILMIRRGQYIFVSSVDDPPLLFDLDADPHERTNLANESTHAVRVSQFLSEVSRKWNQKELTKNIRLSQRQRRLILRGYDHGAKPRWNRNEDATSDVIWNRDDGGYTEWAFSYLPVLAEEV